MFTEYLPEIPSTFITGQSTGQRQMIDEHTLIFPYRQSISSYADGDEH